MTPTTIPHTIDELLTRVDLLAGLTIAELAAQLGVVMPRDLRREKGFVGQLIELALGASAGNRPEPDFVELGVELKTIPLSFQGAPLETTYVCVVPLQAQLAQSWQASLLRKKLNHVLWMPVEGERSIPLAERRIGQGFLWQPNADEDSLLRADWEELMEFVALGQVDQLSARHGEVLQIRPKAANASVRTQSIGPDGTHATTLPRGFYLKKNFTQHLLLQHRML